MIKNLIYVSNPVGFNEKNIKNILETSNINNKKNKVTGCLIYRQDLYLQFLEGPQKALEFTYNKILSDKRHTDIHKLSENSTKRRLFTNWAMRGDPLMTSMWTNKDIKDGKVSPWLILNSKTGKEMLSKFNDEQLQIVFHVMNPQHWALRFKRSIADVELVKEISQKAGI